MGAFYPLLLLLLIVGQIEGRGCPSADGTLYYIRPQCNGTIVANRYVGGEHQTDKDFTIKTGATKIQTLAFDFQTNELLFVDEKKPNTIYGIGRAVEIHPIVRQKGISFDRIAVDPITKNIYFADNKRGIGACYGHGPEAVCNLLYRQPNNISLHYHDLTLNPNHGIMFWLQKARSLKSELKMASMNGKHVRTLFQFRTAHSIAMDTHSNDLYISFANGTVMKMNVPDQFIEAYHENVVEIGFFNCDIYGYTTDSSKKAFSPNMTFPEDTFLVVLDIDRTPKPNPCKSMQCDNGICVLAENQPKTVAECIQFESKPQTTTPKIESKKNETKSAEIRVEYRIQRHPVDGFLISMVVLLSLCLIVSICAFIFYTKPHILVNLRNRIPCIAADKDPLAASYQKSSTSAMSSPPKNALINLID